MKIVRVDSRVDDITYGAVEPEGIRLYLGSPFVAWEPTETVVAWDEVKLLSPVIPTKIIAAGRNYVEHAHRKVPVDALALRHVAYQMALLFVGLAEHSDLARRFRDEIEAGFQ